MIKSDKARAATISMVADDAGVSRATVSRAFSNPELLTKETVEKVRASAIRLGYVPNQVARALSTGRSGNIALIVPDIGNPFFSALMRGAQAQAYARGYATFLGDSDENEALEDLLLGKLAAQVDGFVLASPRLDEQRIRAHAALKPLVVINRDIADISRILVDTVGSFTQAVKHLVELGHTTMAYVGGPKASWSNQQRAQAVTSAAHQYGIRLVLIDAVRPSHEAGRACVGSLLSTGATAVLAIDDLVAQGIISGLAALNLSVPGDISVVGCDNIIATTMYPSLTTVDAHCAETGAKAIDLLLQTLSQQSQSQDRKVINGEFIARASTGPLAHGEEAFTRRSKAAEVIEQLANSK
ncbi:LacI family DNA-binding transcriptional regulator [Rhizobium sp. BK376]|uniref:LacI family DNA-binding transcriptional regulator n=1 Tax=Rhizobium sp. BK376 TaxID=2512149 RepID=UPI00104B6458|nr:LacI family DNA-binding transcriptional regulator [Rhizobium sp. BK376]TCR79504.1 LacI family transcriptional regulator [Rhizobium sp. BK376]